MSEARSLSSEESLVRALASGQLAEPQHLLGPQRRSRGSGLVVRAHHPEALRVECLLEGGQEASMKSLGTSGLFEVDVPEPDGPLRYRLRFHFADGSAHETHDPYRFPVGIGDVDLYLLSEGTHRSLWRTLGAHEVQVDGVSGVRFAVWAPRARRVSVVGDFCHWDGRLLPMRRLGHSGVFELFVPGVASGDFYKFEILTAAGDLRVKTDPFAFSMEHPPGTASRVFESRHRWEDGEWLEVRRHRDALREPMAVYEVHLGSWLRGEHGSLGYRELAERLIPHVQRFGFTHIELLPVTEFPFDGSWGYQVSGYFAPTARHGDPDDFRAFVDACHRAGLGVILDWVPAHFPRDDFALRRFDGEPLFEYADPRMGEHPDWGTLVFDFGRNEVRNFLIANALYWLQEFHVDGLRVDAVASMLYRDYSREEGDWLPNVHGGRENLEAVSLLRSLNGAVHEECPGCFTVAEESTAWPGVSRPEHEGGLGFDFKWNLGWMHDTLGYFGKDPIHRTHHQDQLSFASIYEYTEHFVMPLSHDEVVHGKGSLLGRMPGDDWQRFANLRCLLAYQYTRPGKKLLFMGSELAPEAEWQADRSLEWALADEPLRQALGRFLEALGGLYRERPCLWRNDPSPEGFHWIDCADREQSVFAYLRRDEDDELIVVLNLTPVPRHGYRIGVPRAGAWRDRLCSDDGAFGGSDHPRGPLAHSEPAPWHGEDQSVSLVLPPLSVRVLERSDA